MCEQPTCRLCMSVEGQLEEIFLSPDMMQKILDCTTIEVKNTKGLPTCICEICKSEIIIWSKFKRQCLKTDEFLKSKFPDLFMNKNPEKIENDTPSLTDGEDSDGIVNVEYIEDMELQFSDARKYEEEQIDAEVKSEYGQDIDHSCQEEEEENDEEEASEDNRDIEVLDVNFATLDDDELVQQFQDGDTIEVIELIDDTETLEIDTKILKSVSSEDISKIGQKANSKSREVWKTTNGNRIKYHTKCKICGKLQQNIKQHMLIHSDEMPFQCPYCKRGFRQRSNFKHHVYIHTGEKPYKCKSCEKAFSDPASLRSHMIQHTGERRYHCDMCGKAFGHSHTLAAHKRIHTQDRRHFCEYCTKKFLSKHALKKHIRTHTGERPYHCDQCPKNFSTSGNLTTHKRVHTKERPYQCQFCGLDFAYKCVLNTHMKRHKKKLDSKDNADEWRDSLSI